MRDGHQPRPLVSYIAKSPRANLSFRIESAVTFTEVNYPTTTTKKASNPVSAQRRGRPHRIHTKN